MLLALSLVSSQGLWILADDEATQLRAHETWTDTESFGLSDALQPKLSELLAASKITLDGVTRLAVVTGPGAFTGLRISSAFMQGLARARRLPLYGISTFELVGSSFLIPLQHQKARGLDLEQAVNGGMEFLRIDGESEFQIDRPNGKLPVWGLLPEPFWPRPEELLKACGRALAKSATPEGLVLRYGLEPKISGQRGV